MEIRPARPEDSGAIRNVHLRAFPTPVEADLVERLEIGKEAEISIVADDGEIVGHLLLSRMRVEANGQPVRALGLAPVAVMPERQGQGIGKALIEAGIREARARGAEIIFVVGEHSYYRRFGFDSKTAEPFESPYAGRYFQALALLDLPPPHSAIAEYAPAFQELE